MGYERCINMIVFFLDLYSQTSHSVHIYYSQEPGMNHFFYFTEGCFRKCSPDINATSWMQQAQSEFCVIYLHSFSKETPSFPADSPIAPGSLTLTLGHCIFFKSY